MIFFSSVRNDDNERQKASLSSLNFSSHLIAVVITHIIVLKVIKLIKVLTNVPNDFRLFLIFTQFPSISSFFVYHYYSPSFVVALTYIYIDVYIICARQHVYHSRLFSGLSNDSWRFDVNLLVFIFVNY